LSEPVAKEHKGHRPIYIGSTKSQVSLADSDKFTKFLGLFHFWRRSEIVKSVDIGKLYISSLSEHFYAIRKRAPRVCSSCGVTEVDAGKKLHWHHLDAEISNRMIEAIDAVQGISAWEAPRRFLEWYQKYLVAAYQYWGVPLDGTILLCPKCHKGEHRKDIPI
jgi:hypothetical protein